MAVYDQSYQPWSGAVLPRPARIWALVAAGFRVPFGSRWNQLVMALIYLLILGWVFILWVIASADNPPPISLGNNLYRDSFFNHPLFGYLIMILAATVGAAMISRDLQYNALLTYFSKAVTRTDYLIAKFATLVLFLLTVTLGPALLLWLSQWSMGMEEVGWGARLRDLAAVVAHSLVICIPVAAVVLAFSSMTKRAVVAGMMWVLAWLLSDLLPFLLEATVRGDWPKLLRFQSLTAHAANGFYQDRPMKVSVFQLTQPLIPIVYEPYVAGAVLLGLTVLAIAIIRLRLRISEARE